MPVPEADFRCPESWWWMTTLRNQWSQRSSSSLPSQPTLTNGKGTCTTFHSEDEGTRVGRRARWVVLSPGRRASIRVCYTRALHAPPPRLPLFLPLGVLRARQRGRLEPPLRLHHGQLPPLDRGRRLGLHGGAGPGERLRRAPRGPRPEPAPPLRLPRPPRGPPRRARRPPHRSTDAGPRLRLPPPRRRPDSPALHRRQGARVRRHDPPPLHAHGSDPARARPAPDPERG